MRGFMYRLDIQRHPSGNLASDNQWLLQSGCSLATLWWVRVQGETMVEGEKNVL
jgi:hypothetical protein